MPDGSALIRLIKKAAIDAVKHREPVEIVFGTITRIGGESFRVRLNQKTEIGMGHFVRTNALLDISGGPLGARLVLLKMQGGQSYYFLERLV